MYRRELRKRGDINSVDINKRITNLFSGKYPNRCTNNSLTYYENLQRELEARKSRSSRALYQKLKDNQNKINYTNEIQRIRGEISKDDTRLPIGTRDRLDERIKKLKELGGQVVDEINLECGFCRNKDERDSADDQTIPDCWLDIYVLADPR